MSATKPKDRIKANRLAKKVSIAAIAKEVGKSPTFVAAALNLAIIVAQLVTAVLIFRAR